MSHSSVATNRKRLQVATILRELRTNAGLQQADVAARLGRPQSFVSRCEAGERRLDLPELDEICKVLGVSLRDFVERFEADK